MSKSKLLTWIIVLLLVVPFVLTACGDADSIEEAVEEAAQQVEEAQPTDEPAEEPADEPAEEPADEPAEEPADEPAEEPADVGYDTDVYGMIDEIDLDGVQVVFWHQHSREREEELLKIVDEFNAQNEYGIVVEARNEGGYDDIYNKMITGLTSGELPGLVVAYQNQAAAYQVADGLVSLDPYINDPMYGLTEEEQADFFQAFLNGDRLPQFGGESFGFPPNRSMEVLYYNAEWLQELYDAGAIDFEGAPQNPDQFAQAMCAASENPFSKNVDPNFSVGYEISTDASRVASLIFARGGDIYDYDANQFTYNSPEAVEAFTQMQELFDQGCATLIAERFGDQTDFGNGKTLFTIGSSSGLPFYASAVNDGEAGGFEWSAAPIPYTTDEPVVNIYGASVSIPKTDPATQLAAWLFVKYYTSPDIQARWARVSNYFPVRESVADGLGDYFAENPAYETAFSLLPYGKTEAPVAGYDNVRTAAEEAYNRILSGEDAATVLADLDVQANQILEDAAPDGQPVTLPEPEPTEEPAEEPATIEYDTDVYGMIDEIDLDGVQVVFWHQHSREREEELLKIVDEFNAQNEYGIVVEARNEGGYDDIYNKMITGLTSGELPGLVVAYQNQAAAYQVADGLVSLDPYINDPMYGLTEEEQADFFQAFLNGDRLPQFGGESFGFPPNRSMEVLYYNAEWLQELYDAGAIDFEGAPQNPDQFAQAMCAASENPFSKNVDPNFSVGYEISTDASRVASLIFARGGDIYDYDANQFTYNSPEAVEAFTQMQELFDQGCATLIAERFGDQTDFGNGKTLFTIGSSSGLPFYASAVNDGEAGGFEWSAAPIPYTTDEPVVNIYGASVSIPKTDPATQLAAWLFVKYYTSPDIQARWARVSNYFPVRESVADGLGDYFAENPAYETAFSLLPYGKTEAPVAGYDNVRTAAEEAYNRILSGEDAATVLADLDVQANQILEDAAP